MSNWGGRLRDAGLRARGCPPIVYSEPDRDGMVALSFDDGPSRWSEAIGLLLHDRGAAATFFALGSMAAARPGSLVALTAGGHEIGNHLWSHSDPAKQSVAELRDEISRTQETITAATGTAPVLVRPPFCGAPARVSRAARRLGFDAVALRSVDPADWRQHSAATITTLVLDRVAPGDIVCLHDGIAPGGGGTDSRAPTLAAVATILNGLEARGLRAVTVSQLLG